MTFFLVLFILVYFDFRRTVYSEIKRTPVDMTPLIFFSVMMSVTLGLPSQTYNPEYDNFNAEELAENVILLKKYGNCFLDKGPCTAEGSDIKSKKCFFAIILNIFARVGWLQVRRNHCIFAY